MKKMWKRIMAACCIAVMIVTLPGGYVLADEDPAEDRCIIDTEEAFSEDILIEDSLGIYDEASTLEESEADIPTENELTGLTDEPIDAVRLHEDQADMVADDIALQEAQTIEDTDVEELCGAVSHSRDEAVAWANSKVGQQVEYDNVPGAEFQCVDLTKSYYAYLGQPAPSGNANLYGNGGRFTPSGWTYQSSPLPGDIAVWTGGQYGHVAIVTEIRGSQMVCVEQNYNYVSRVTANLHNINAQTYIRPDFPNPDNSGPSYSDFHVGELREGAFTILAHVTDPSGIKEVSYAVWTNKNGQDDLVWHGGNCTDGNNYYWSRVNFSEHNGERGSYIIHMYAYDNYGNLTTAGIGFDFDADGPQISEVKVSDVSSSGYTVTCKVTDPSGILRVQFPTWTVSGGQDDIAQNWGINENVRGAINNNMVTFRVKASEHNNEVGIYRTHIYAYDILGNVTFATVPDVDVRDMIALNQLTVSLSSTSYTYNGSAKKPAVTVKNGSIALTSGTDYTVAYKNNTNAGTATVTITGKGNFTGTISKTFTIKKAVAKLTFANASVSKTTKDAAFTNTLTKTTDGTVTFKSSNTSVATVSSTSGKVTIKGAGETTITATASAGTNYKAGSASYTLTVKAPAPAGFSDVQDPTHPFYKAIYWAADAGITKGYSDGTFGIDRACTRSEAVMFLWRMAGKPAPVDALSSPFSDVPKSHAHYKAILWAAQKGITKGYSDGTFGINKTCTRGQIMTFIWRFKGQPAPKTVAKSPFSDVPKNHAYYKAILWGAQTGVTNGFSDGTFGINKNCTRGQIVTFLYRIK